MQPPTEPEKPDDGNDGGGDGAKISVGTLLLGGVGATGIAIGLIALVIALCRKKKR